jgi:HEAT repeat protein
MRYQLIPLSTLMLLSGCGNNRSTALPPAQAPIPARNSNEGVAAVDDTIVDWLQSGDEDYMRAAAILARKRPSRKTREALMALASGRERAWPLRQIGCDALQDINLSDVTNMWLAMLDEPYEPAVARAARALAPLKNPDHVPNLVTAYTNVKSKEVINQQSAARYAIVQALQQIGDLRALPIYLQGIRSPDYNVRNTSHASISSLKLDGPALQQLLQMLKEAGHPSPGMNDVQLHQTLLNALNANSYKPAAQIALEIVRKPHHANLTDTLFLLLTYGCEPNDFDALKELLKAEWPRTRTGNYQNINRCQYTVRAIASTGRKEAAAEFLELFKEGMANGATHEALKYLPQLVTEKHTDALLEIHSRMQDEHTRQSLASLLSSGRFPVRYNQSDKCFQRLPDAEKTPVEK